MISIQYAWILLFAISLTNAVPLNSNCGENVLCDGTGVVCRGGKCQCNTPFYKPCNTSCEVVGRFVYEGGQCEVPENCIQNAGCVNNKCQCNDGYTLKNGACFKNLNATCQNSGECWSEYCSQTICTCPTGYTRADDATTCRQKLVNVYNTWNDANAQNAFCEDNNSCLDIIATCVNDTAHPQLKFCKCPYGYTTENLQCKAIINQNLSPLDSTPPTGYGECGICADENAACIKAANQITCWCRAGYVKQGNKCGSRGKSAIIFPNLQDVQMHDFTSGCSLISNASDQVKNRLCVCAAGYTFVPGDRSCKKIEPRWIDMTYEYGLCTSINSQDEAEADDGVCPEPLKCRAKNDKHVCSCGNDKFQDLDNPTQCVYFIGKGANATDRQCPSNTRTGTTDNCACADGYKATSDNKRCELKLSPQTVDTSCNANLTSLQICGNFGEKVVLCMIGECRCLGNDSLPNNDQTHCYAPVNTPLPAQKESCPPDSRLNGNTCDCSDGFHPSTDLRECVPWNVQLTEYQGPPMTSAGGLANKDCQALFGRPAEAHDNDRCQCQSDAFIDESKTGCRYKLNVMLPDDQAAIFCPLYSTYISGRLCICSSGFKEENNLCIPITDKVYSYNDPSGLNITGIDDVVCRTLFGAASKQSLYGSYCACLDIAYPVLNNKYCHFLINRTSLDLKSPAVCPAHTNVFPAAQPSACVCDSGYRASSDDQTCVLANIQLVGTEKMDNTNNCSSFTNDDCIARYGEQAFCKNEQCYCNRQLSFLNNQRCQSFSKYKFPGEHELYLHACQEDDDCAGKGAVTCDYVDSSSKYKVCRCQDGAYLNAESQTCEDNRCMNCNPALNLECRDYVCQCKSGYIRNGAGCDLYTTQLQLYQPCNRTIFRDIPADKSLVCDANCNHARCNYGHRIDNTNCVPYQLASDKCINQEYICSEIDQNAGCYRDKNQCFCGPSYYLVGNKCARAVGVGCIADEQCGIGECKARQCACKGGQRVEDSTDVSGRQIKRCANGIDQLRSNPVLLFLLLFVLARVVFN